MVAKIKGCKNYEKMQIYRNDKGAEMERWDGEMCVCVVGGGKHHQMAPNCIKWLPNNFRQSAAATRRGRSDAI